MKKREKDKENFTQLSTKDTNNSLETLTKIALHQSLSLELSNLLSTAKAKFHRCLHLLMERRVGGRLENANKTAEDSFITDSFNLSLCRFISRKGHAKTIKSDNCTMFVGAAIELKKSQAS